MIFSPETLVALIKTDPEACKNVVFQKYHGTRGEAVATVEAPMNRDEAVAYCEELIAAKGAKPQPAKGKTEFAQ